jgi:hypothetical protein
MRSGFDGEDSAPATGITRSMAIALHLAQKEFEFAGNREFTYLIMTKQTHSTWLVLTLLVGLSGIWLAWRQLRPMLANRAPLPVLGTAKFDDGTRLEVLGVGLDHTFAFSRHTNPHLIPTLASAASQGFMTGGFEIKTWVNDDQFAGVELRNQQKTPMLGIVFRLMDSNQRPLSTDRFYAAGECQQITRSGAYFGSVRSLGGMGRGTERLDWTVELEDGQGSWILMEGPFVVDMVDGRAISVCYAYPRDQECLRLRVSRKMGAGRASVEVSLKTPGFKPSYAPLKAETLPITKRAGDYEVTLKAFRNLQRFLVPDFEAHHEVADEKSLKIAWQFEDHFGNVLPSLPGVMPLPGAQTLRVVSEVTRNPTLFPYERHEVEMLAEVIWSADESQRQVMLTDLAKSRGIHSVVLTAGNGALDGQRQLPHSLNIRVQGRTPEVAWNLWGRDWHRDLIGVFLNDAERCAGESRRASSRWETSAGRVEFDLQADWYGELADGAHLNLGYARQTAPVRVTFDVAVPEPQQVKTQAVRSR